MEHSCSRVFISGLIPDSIDVRTECNAVSGQNVGWLFIRQESPKWTQGMFLANRMDVTWGVIDGERLENVSIDEKTE